MFIILGCSILVPFFSLYRYKKHSALTEHELERQMDQQRVSLDRSRKGLSSSLARLTRRLNQTDSAEADTSGGSGLTALYSDDFDVNLSQTHPSPADMRGKGTWSLNWFRGENEDYSGREC